ncbi:MAG: bifunctional tetrahydrofolate synthase/dihydrofolate synthase [Ottowia sp.]|nr:bifunctional tetrahydrofolate synthase/dihydrofolate synthase [Ottowia sp.]
MKTLQDWLAYCEQLHPATIAMGLERVHEVAARLPLQLDCTVITVAGTNGKGSTCAMLAAMLQAGGFRVGLYTSPHLVHFQERCRVDGRMVDAAALVPHFERVEQARQGVSLTYFEFTTLAILDLFAQAQLDVVILEVGLGGRLDAVNIIDADCAIITSIDIDHVEYLGDTREEIGREQAGIMRAGKPAILGDPVPPQSVLDHARDIGADLWRHGQEFNFQGTRVQWGWAGRGRRYNGLGYPALPGANQLLNAATAIAALVAMRKQLAVSAQAIKVGLGLVDLPGRFQVVPGQPILVLDVAHNPHAAATLAQNLNAMGFYSATHVVFGAMADKDIAAMLGQVEPHVDHWYFTDLPTPRARSAQDIHALWQATTRRPDMSVGLYASPKEALQAAAGAAHATDRIVCFGSFHVVGGIIENGVPQLEPGARAAPSLQVRSD